VRFMDDMVLWDNCPEQLNRWHLCLGEQLHNTHSLELKSSSKITKSSDGLLFLGYRLVPQGIWMASAGKKRFVRRLNASISQYTRGDIDSLTLSRKTGALLAYTHFARALQWRRRVVNSLEEVSI
ncbi:MAG: hypothetical protein AAGB06_00005, partial [Verrucomicrobiota bacterium]